MTVIAPPLARRTDLPEEFRLILAELPRAGWPAHRDFNGLAAFWLDRHLGFRRTLLRLTEDAEARIDARIAPEDHARRLSRVGSGFLGELVGHHQIEDDAYFPKLARLEPRIARGFDMLDADHHSLHDLIEGFVTTANAALSAPTDTAGREATAHFLAHLRVFDRQLDRHLTDEEDLVVPVVLKHRIG